jgi:hypothetical protein
MSSPKQGVRASSPHSQSALSPKVLITSCPAVAAIHVMRFPVPRSMGCLPQSAHHSLSSQAAIRVMFPSPSKTRVRSLLTAKGSHAPKSWPTKVRWSLLTAKGSNAPKSWPPKVRWPLLAAKGIPRSMPLPPKLKRSEAILTSSIPIEITQKAFEAAPAKAWTFRVRQPLLTAWVAAPTKAWSSPHPPHSPRRPPNPDRCFSKPNAQSLCQCNPGNAVPHIRP